MDVTRLLNTDQDPSSRRQSVAQTSLSPSADASNDESRSLGHVHASQPRNPTPFSATSSTSRPWSREQDGVASPLLHTPATPGNHAVRLSAASRGSPGGAIFQTTPTSLQERSPHANGVPSPAWSHRVRSEENTVSHEDAPISSQNLRAASDYTAMQDQTKSGYWSQSASVSPRMADPGAIPKESRHAINYTTTSNAETVFNRSSKGREIREQGEDQEFQQPPPKKRKLKSPPIWARRCMSTAPLKKSKETAARSVVGGVSEKVSDPGKPQSNGGNGPLGPWEPTFTNVIPYEELTRRLCDFFYMEVVLNDAFETKSADGCASSSGEVEIEAKIGTLIDRSTNERLSLPIQTEAIIRDDLNVNFESKMTLEQHAFFNERLNEAVKQSKMPSSKEHKKPRISMDYRHLREVDHFFTLPKSELSALPAKVREHLHRNTKHNTPRIRITRDQKSGNVIAKIIKVRLKDFHVYSPRTRFDWRISISLELRWDGDVEKLRLATKGEEPELARYKDRMSYKHLFSQIDLTQVARAPGNAPSDILSWELEVEVSADEVRRQGRLAAEGKENQYEELVKSFVDNVRILARTSPEGQ